MSASQIGRRWCGADLSMVNLSVLANNTVTRSDPYLACLWKPSAYPSPNRLAHGGVWCRCHMRGWLLRGSRRRRHNRCSPPRRRLNHLQVARSQAVSAVCMGFPTQVFCLPCSVSYNTSYCEQWHAFPWHWHGAPYLSLLSAFQR